MNIMLNPRDTGVSREYPEISREQAAKMLPRVCGGKLDPYFPARGVTCGEEHLKYVLCLAYALLCSYRSVFVGHSPIPTYGTIGMLSVGDRDLDHIGPGHVRYIGPPGTGKSFAANVPRKAVGAKATRVQGTIDLLPGDITGTHIVQVDETGKRTLEFKQGPVFSDILLFDELSRAPGRAQVGLLQSMSEGYVTVDGVTHAANPWVIGTDNTADSGGVERIPDAMLDRIVLQVLAKPFTAEEFSEILRRTRKFHHVQLEQITDYGEVTKARLYFHDNIHVSNEMEDFMGRFAYILNNLDRLDLMGETRRRIGYSDNEDLIRPGSMILSGRGLPHWEGVSRVMAALRYRRFLTHADVQKMILPVIRHRVRFKPNALANPTIETVRDHLKKHYGGTGKTEMSEFLLSEMIRIAWTHASARKR